MSKRYTITLTGCGCDNLSKPRRWTIEAENEAEARRIGETTKANLAMKGWRFKRVRVKQIP